MSGDGERLRLPNPKVTGIDSMSVSVSLHSTGNGFAFGNGLVGLALISQLSLGD